MVDARLKDGSRVNAIIPPLSLDGPVLSIRDWRGTASDVQATRVSDVHQGHGRHVRNVCKGPFKCPYLGWYRCGKNYPAELSFSLHSPRSTDCNYRGFSRVAVATASCRETRNTTPNIRAKEKWSARPGKKRPSYETGPDRLLARFAREKLSTCSRL